MELKELVGLKAAEYIKDGMTVGLGTGSTAYYFVKEIGRRVNEEGLAITGVTTSIQTKEVAESLGIPLKSVDEVTHIDIHVIQSVPPSNLNRDDTGSPKTALYGGVRRARGEQSGLETRCTAGVRSAS